MEIANIFLGALIGALLTYLARVYFQNVGEKIAVVNEQIDDISKIEDVAVEYWSMKAEDDDVLEKRHGAYLAGVFTGCFEFLECDCPLTDGDQKEVSVLIDMLYRSATGDDFQTSDREVNLQKITEIVSICTRIKAKLRASRRRYFWAH